MAAPKQTLEQKLETAVEALLSVVADLDADITFHQAFDNDEIAEPAVLISATDGGVPPDETNIEPTGNRRLSLAVVLRTHGDYTRSKHNEQVGRLRDELMTDDVAARLSAAAAEFTAFYFQVQDGVRVVEEHSFKSMLTAEVWAAPADF